MFYSCFVLSSNDRSNGISDYLDRGYGLQIITLNIWGGSLDKQYGPELTIWRLWIQVPPWPLDEFVYSSPKFKPWAMLVK